MKRILSTLLALAMLLTVNTYIYAAEKSDDNSEKIICQATLDDDFADDCVIVVIDKSNSKVNKLFTKKQFKGVSLENIKDLTYLEGDPDDLQYLNQEEFKQVLKLDLVKTGKEEVLKAIRKLEKLDFVLAAMPNYYFSPTDLGNEELNLAGEADLSEGTEASGYDEELSGETAEPSSDLSEEDLLSDTEEPSENDSEAELQEEEENSDDSSLTPLSTTPNDPQYTAGNQWGLNMINAPQAWDITTGSSSVLVGVIDTGLANHPDLTANVVWDMARDFYSGTDNSSVVTDDIEGHGTQVASIIGARGNNGTGVSGVCWNVGIVPLQCSITSGENKGKIEFSAVESAFGYAISNNIPILNCSFGGLDEGNEANLYLQIMQNYNGLIVCSAGNDATDTDDSSYSPAGVNMDNIISVAATKANSVVLAEAADWGWPAGSDHGSNFGTATVDIAAPGTGICAANPSGSYDYDFCGTSAAAPFVSGVAALILSIRPDLTGTQLKDFILDYASGYSELQGKVGNNGAYLNAYAALNGAINDTVLVTFNGNGGTANTQSRYYVKGQKYSKLPSVSRSDCTFYGWYRNGSYITENTIVSDSNHTLDAMWRVLIAYYLGDIDAGDSEHISTYHVFGQSKTITLNTYAKDGYKLANWIDNDGNEYTPGSTLVITRKMNFYADWEELYSKLSYETTHFDPITPDTVYYTDTLSYQNKIPASSLHTPMGFYILQGWRIKGGNGTVYSPTDPDTLLDFRSYIFEEAGVGERPFGNVVYDANGGQNAPSEQSRTAADPIIIITNDEPTRQGYSFLGWSDTSDGEVSYAPGSTCSGPSYTTLYAKWAEDCFVVRFGTGTDDDDSAQAYNPPLSVIYEIPESQQDSGITIPDETPTRPSYRFKGWSYTYNGTTTVYQPGDTFILPSAVLTAYDSDGGNIVRLTPVWEKIPSMHPEDFPDEQLMAFVDLPEYGGVTDSTYLRTFTRGETYGDVYVPGDTTKTPAFPVPEEQVVSIDGVRYYFDGWADAAGNIIDEDTPVSKEGFHYIYARWIEEADYTDVTQGSVNSKYISRCRHYGYMSGTSTTTFSPSEDVSRAIAAYVLYRFEGSPLYGNNKFFDVETYKANGDSDPVSEAISWATENSIAFPIDINEFGTENAITREQLVTLIYRYVKYKGVDVSDVDETCLDDFDDQDQISAYADDAMIWAVSKGIITGAVDLSGNTVLAPQGEVTRDQLAILIVRMRNLLIDNDKITTLKNGTVNSNADMVGNLSETLSENSWEAIDLASDAGVSETVWSVGDEKNVTLTTGETVTVQIYDFNHDDLTDGGKAGITFGLKNSMMNARAMNSTNTNANSFVGTTMYTWLNGALYNSMPEDLKNIVKQTDKKTAVGGGSSQIQTDSMKIFLFSESECFGTNYHCTSGEGTQYAIFTDDASRIKIQEGPQIIEWWLRSPRLADSTSFGIVHATGHSGYTSASWEYAGVCFGFCV